MRAQYQMPESVAVLQARTTSSRLPAKSLLPVAGYPLAVLSALRAANKGTEIIVATSNQTEDDALAKAVAEYNITCFRGSLANTLSRFVEALAAYDDTTLVFRLTADNVFPDGHLLSLMESDFIDSGLEYLRCGGKDSGLPYGVSAELTRLVHLREALANATTAFEQEHVTPYIRAKYDASFSYFQHLAKSHYRATVDTLDDYLAVAAVFADDEDPVHTPLLKLIDRLEGGVYQPVVSTAAERFVLGTAQLGMEYGINNATGRPTQPDATQIIRSTIANGAQYLDTARGYLDSEAVIGNALRGGWSERVKVITKLSPLDECPPDAAIETVDAFVKASIYESCTHLGCRLLDTVLLHRAEHIESWNGGVLQSLKSLVNGGVIHRLGVSVQTPDELSLALEHPDLTVIQMPFNILDWRFDSYIPQIQLARERRGLTLHTRSALLQGLLASDDVAKWEAVGIDEPVEIITWLLSQTNKAGASDVPSFCLRYCFSQPWIDGVVVGVENESQLFDNLLFSAEPLTKRCIAKHRRHASKTRFADTQSCKLARHAKVDPCPSKHSI